jgi:ATP-dependent DNA helicase DinG
VVDLETTGLPGDPEAGLLEFGAVLLDPGTREIVILGALVRPERPIPPAIERLTGIGEADVADAPPVEALAAPIRRALAGRTLVAHNASFERHFLARVDPALGEARYLDTQDLLAVTHPDAPDLRLETFSRALLDTEERHRALADALDTVRVLSRLAAGGARGRRLATARAAFAAYAPESPWLALVGKDPAGGALETGERAYVAVGESAEPPVPFDEEAIAAALADGTRGARHFPGYRVRAEQIELARHFARVLARGGTLLLEGGTGVGKSLAYLAALVPWSAERAEAGLGAAVVSTRTKLLQDQLLEKDIPAAARFLGHPGLRALSIKGRANYACERRLATVLAEGREPSIFPEDRLAYAVLAACAALRPHGEIGSVPAAWLRRYPVLADLLRRAVASRAEQCSREQCARHPSCPMGRRRRALAEAHLVVANHDLLLRWPPDYPRFAHAVVDEAHELADVADEVYALEVRPQELLDRIDEVFGRPDGGAEALLPAAKRRAARRDARAWRRGVQQELVALGRALDPLAGEFGEVQVPEGLGPAFEEPAQRAEAAACRLEEVALAVDELAAAAGEAEAPLARSAEELREAGRALRSAFEDAEESVAAFERVEAPWDRWRLALRLVSPAAPFRAHFLEGLHSLAAVSASLFVDGDPFAALGELGIASDRESVRISVPSPFSYAEHMRVVALPDPDDLVEETACTLETLARHLGGRTLGLFTSLRRMRDVEIRLGERLRDAGIEVLAPRRAADDPAALVERFRAGSAVLLGARKFWQGLDIPGRDLQAVVIEKLPFEVPTELRRRRELRLRRAGIDAFERYTLGKMLLNLKQMVGRLIRTEDDRGIVVIVEGRSRRGYFRRLGDALPPGSRVVAARRDELPAILAEVGLG